MRGSRCFQLGAIIALGVVGSLGGIASAGPITLVNYALDTTSLAPTTTAPGVTATSITAGSGILPQGAFSPGNPFPNGNSTFGTVGLRVAPGGAPNSSNNVAASFANHNTFSFTVNLGSGFNLTSLTFNVVAGGASGSRYFGLESSLTGSTNLIDDSNNSSGLAPTSPETITVPLDLLDVSGPVTFTFAVASPNGNESVDFNNITLKGDPVVPEPTTLATFTVFGLLGCCIQIMRRNRMGFKAA